VLRSSGSPTMSTQVPAPLYAYSHISGFRPINTEPGKMASGKSGSSGLMNKVDRLLHPRSTTQSSPKSIDSTTADNPETSSTTVDESRSEKHSDQITLRILTWNIWFESLFKKQRTSALIATIESLNPLPDVCCFQECTAGFELQLQRIAGGGRRGR